MQEKNFKNNLSFNMLSAFFFTTKGEIQKIFRIKRDSFKIGFFMI